MTRTSFLCLLLAGLAGCVSGPDYQRPQVVTPAAWRTPVTDAADLANTAWWNHFKDSQLDELIRVALEENKDLRIAALRVEEFGARLQVNKSAAYPQIGYGAGLGRDRLSQDRQIPLPLSTPRTGNAYEIRANASWELDFWGRVRRSNEAALAELLSVEENQRAVVLSLVSDVAAAYVRLLSLDKELEIAKRTLDSRSQTVKLFESKYAGGGIARLGLAQVRSAYEETATVIPAIEREIALLEHALSSLLGRNPGPIKRADGLAALAVPAVPEGLPSDILVRRPDIRRAEQDLVAANARIGVARAQYLPSISLTGLFGYASTDLSRLLQGSAGFGSAGASLLGPIFDGGRIEGDVRQAEAVRTQALVKYQSAVQTALREVEDALISNRKSIEQLAVANRQVAALQEYATLARKRYDGGYSSYIEVLDAERGLFAGEISKAQVQRDALVALIGIYKAMGGGWVDDAAVSRQVAHSVAPTQASRAPATSDTGGTGQ